MKRFFDIQTEEELLDVLNCDFYYLSFRDISQNESFLPFYNGPVLERTETERKCPFGIQYRRGAYDSKFAVDEVIQSPLEHVTNPEAILKHRWPEVDPRPGHGLLRAPVFGLLLDSPDEPGRNGHLPPELRS